MKQCYIVVDVAKCHDCNNCFMACKDEHVGNDWPGYTAAQPRHGHRWINIERRERGQYPRNDVAYLPVPCQHCEEAPCIAASNGAITRREDGIVMIDMEKAKGNKALVDSCPYNAIFWNEDENIAQKCTMCAHLLDNEEWKPAMPRCVHTCPTGALTFYKVEPAEMEKKIAEENLVAYMEELNAKPRVLYKNLYRFTKNHITGGVVVNGDCYEGAEVTLKSTNGGMVCTLKGAGVAASCTDTSILAVQRTNVFGDFKFDGLDNGDYIVEIDIEGKKSTFEVKIDDASVNLGYLNL